MAEFLFHLFEESNLQDPEFLLLNLVERKRELRERRKKNAFWFAPNEISGGALSSRDQIRIPNTKNCVQWAELEIRKKSEKNPKKSQNQR
jgi:hypothetical protein